QTEGPARQPLAHQRTGQGILTVHHNLPGTTEDPVFGQVIRRQAAVAVHVVFADVQYGGDFSTELICRLKLETRQLQHVQLDVVAEQVQRWRAEVAADRNTLAGRRCHFTYERGHGAFRVGTADGDDRRFRVTREQLDITGKFHATGCCRL